MDFVNNFYVRHMLCMLYDVPSPPVVIGSLSLSPACLFLVVPRKKN